MSVRRLCKSCGLPLDRNVGACRQCFEIKTKRCASHGESLPGCARCLSNHVKGREIVARRRAAAAR